MINEKVEDMKILNSYREELKKEPVLKDLFLELTTRCNERCLHCGSYCGEKNETELSVEQYKKFLDDVKRNFDINKFLLCITGGEPLIRKDFFCIMDYANSLGYNWGMTSNGILIDKNVAEKLAFVGMKTISISIDGLEKTHDSFRQTPGGYNKAMAGIQNLIDVGKFKHIQITTVVTHQNIVELDELFNIIKDINIDSWRVVNMEPMGRAKDHPELLLTKEDYIKLFNFIKNKRLAGYPVEYGCSHYLGLEFEHEIRNWYFLCSAGTGVASITTTGDIVSCLDIERRPEFIQGNIFNDNFKDVWYNKFKEFRRDLSDNCYMCQKCNEKDRCHGDSFHSWNFDENRPNLCFKDILF